MDFDNLDDFGLKAISTSSGNTFIRCESDLPNNQIFNQSTINSENDGTTGKFYTMEDILSGGTLSVALDDSISYDQAELKIDTTIAKNLAHFGSVYSTIAIYLNKIKSEYPNGFLISDSVTGTNTVVFNNNDMYMYGGSYSSITDYSEYELIQSYNDELDQTFNIVSATTGGTFSMLTLDGQPSSGSGYDHMVQPKTSYLDKYYSRISQYELDLLIPPYYRTNGWPRDLVAENNILLEGDRYDEFVETELNIGTLSDQDSTNIMWRRMYPDGQKILDSDDSIMQKLILVYAANFDTIKRYQEGLKYQQTIGYDPYNNVSNDLVELLASQWNLSLGRSLNQSDYSKFIYSTYDNYVTGQSQQKISERQVNFELWRRILSNIVSLYKKKGTKDAIKYIANLYGLPEDLFWIQELVETIDNNSKKKELVESESNIVVPISGILYYVDSTGEKKSLETPMVYNTKYLNINVSPYDAIEFDYFYWGWENHPDVSGPDGTVAISGYTSEPNRITFINDVTKKLIGSDGRSRYQYRYPYLINAGKSYYDNSINKYTLENLEPYMNFLDDNWGILITKLIPSSSRLVSNGNLYRNPFWSREKYQWQDSELDDKELPFNSGATFGPLVPSISLQNKLSSTIEIQETSAQKTLNNNVSIDIAETNAYKTNQHFVEVQLATESGKIYGVPYGMIDLEDPQILYVDSVDDTIVVDQTLSGSVLITSSPLFYPYYGQYGTLDYVDYTSTSLIVTSQNTVSIPFSASNLSDSGYTQLVVELFKKAYDTVEHVDESRTYSILNVVNENNGYGTYKVSSTYQYEVGDWIKIKSEYLPYINSLVNVSHIDSGTNQIRTSPKIGLLQSPSGSGNEIVDWNALSRSNVISTLRLLYNDFNMKYVEIIGAIEIIISYGQSRSVNLPNKELIDYVNSLNLNQYCYNGVSQLINYPDTILFGAMLTLEYLRSSNIWTINSNPVSLFSMVSSDQLKATFNRVVDFFDWSNPSQMVVYDNVPENNIGGNWNLPSINVTARTSNDFSTSGSVLIGGLNDLNSEILKDKEEYFMRFKAITHTPIEFGDVDGLPVFSLSGGSLLESNYDIQYVNNIKYYGNYFIYMRTPNIPNMLESPDYSGVTDNSSVIVKWNGVSDSNRMEIEFMEVTGGGQFSSYTNIPDSAWTSSAFTINIPSRLSVDDAYIYTVQTTLDPDTYYWWRVKNFRSKLNMFGLNLEYFTSTQPSLFLTGSFGDGGTNEGEIPTESTPPDGGSDRNSLNQN